MILVAVGEDQRLDLPLAIFEISQVGNDQVHAELIGLGEHRTGVDNDSGISTRDGHHVQAELAEAAERHHVDCKRRG